MQGYGPDFIPGNNGKNQKPLRHDSVDPSKEGGTLKDKRKKRSVNVKMMIREIMKRSLHPTLSGNPIYYPPQPQYAVPDTIDDARDFLVHGICIKETGYDSIELDSELDIINDIDPTILSGSLFYGGDIDIIQQNEQEYSLSGNKLSTWISYRVSGIYDNGKEILTGIYVLKTQVCVKALLGFLADLEVSNTLELEMARKHLTDLYFSLQIEK